MIKKEINFQGKEINPSIHIITNYSVDLKSCKATCVLSSYITEDGFNLQKTPENESIYSFGTQGVNSPFFAADNNNHPFPDKFKDYKVETSSNIIKIFEEIIVANDERFTAAEIV